MLWLTKGITEFAMLDNKHKIKKNLKHSERYGEII